SRGNPAGPVAIAISAPSWVPPILLMGTSLLLRFPDGRLFSPRWRKVEWIALVTLVIVVLGITFSPGNLADFGYPNLANPLGIDVLKYRLYDIDLVINKSVVYGAMAAFITLVYVAIVVGIGRAIGSDRNLGLSILATALVAVGFQPVRERVQRLANRLVYGKRATPYEVLSEFSGRMAEAYTPEEFLPRMASILAEGTGASRADVWLKVGSRLQTVASWPREVPPSPPLPLAGTDVPLIPGADRAVPVRYQGEILGSLSIAKRPG